MRSKTLGIALVCAVTSALSACTDVDDVQVGMSESALIARLGSPDQRVDDEATIKLYSTGQGCPSGVMHIWIYERMLREDILVGLNPDGRVRCAWDAAVYEFID
jgi:hypothetical protein